MVSIILPTYNGAKYLEFSLQSCLDQRYSNWELIIVDDASTDETPKILNRFCTQDRRVRTIRHTNNKRLPAALNTGFAAAKGDYLTWTSDDNCYRPQALSRMVDFLESNSQIDIVYSDHMRIDESGKPVALMEAQPVEELTLENVVGPCFLYRMKVQLDLGGYQEDTFLAEDFDFWLRASIKFKLQALHEDLYLYRLHGGSLTTAYATRIRMVADRALLKHLPQMDWVKPVDRARAYFVIGARAEELGIGEVDLTAIMQTAVQSGFLETYPQFASHHLIYAPGGVIRSKNRFYELLNLLPEENPSVRKFKQMVWGRYHAVHCFDGYQKEQARIVRKHFPQAIWKDVNWLKNRALLRIVLWAYTHR